MIMVSVLLLITVLLFFPIQSDIIQQLREKRKRRNEIAEFDTHSNINFAKKIGENLETQLGRSYELLGHKMSNLGSQLEQNRNSLAKKATDIYTGPLADKSGVAYEKFQYGYGKMGDGLSSILKWLGQNVRKLGHNSGSMIRSSFHTIGDIIGDTVDKTEDLIGKGLIQTGENVHTAAIDLQRTSHNDSENFRHKFLETAPKFEQSLNHAISNFGEKLHTFGLDTETAGEIIEQHHFLDTLKHAYHD